MRVWITATCSCPWCETAPRWRRANRSRSPAPRCSAALGTLDAEYKRFLYPQTYVVGMESGLARVRDELVRERMAETQTALPWKARK